MYLRMLAVSRLYLDNFPHVQASWFSEGKRTGQIALHFGADDWGGTLLEENVHKAARVREHDRRRRDRHLDPRRRLHPRPAHDRVRDPEALLTAARVARYLITASARPTISDEIVTPSALAVLRLTASSKVAGRVIGMSPGLAPFRMRST